MSISPKLVVVHPLDNVRYRSIVRHLGGQLVLELYILLLQLLYSGTLLLIIEYLEQQLSALVSD
ncbi:MAG: hypothetical protein AAFU83_02455, partial [Bacteroidota bacterium]